MAVSNAEGFLAGFLGAANKDNEERRAQQTKRDDLNMRIAAKRKEMVFVNEYKNYESVKALQATLANVQDPIARQAILAEREGIPAAIWQKRGLNLQVPKLPENPMDRLDSLEAQHSVGKSPLVSKLRGMINNLKVTMGSPEAPQVPEAPQASVVPGVSVAPVAQESIATPTTQELAGVFGKPKKKDIQIIEREGKTFYVDKEDPEAGAKELKGVPVEAEGHKWQLVETEAVDPETQETTVELQAVRIDKDSGETILGSNAVTKKVKTATSAKPKAIPQTTTAQVNHQLRLANGLKTEVSGLIFDLDNDTEIAQSSADHLNFLMNQPEPMHQEEAQMYAMGRGVATHASVEDILDNDLMERMGPLLDDKGQPDKLTVENMDILWTRIQGPENLEIRQAFIKFYKDNKL